MSYVRELSGNAKDRPSNTSISLTRDCWRMSNVKEQRLINDGSTK